MCVVRQSHAAAGARAAVAVRVEEAAVQLQAAHEQVVPEALAVARDMVLLPDAARRAPPWGQGSARCGW